jgi:hypothetical protein
MRRGALAVSLALGTPVIVASGACGTQEWDFVDPAQQASLEASLEATLADVEVDAPGDASPHDVSSEGDSASDACDTDAMRCPISCAAAPCPSSAPVCTLPRLTCEGCRSNDDCDTVRAGPICTQSGACVAECSSDRNCPSSRPRCDRPIGRCVRCLSDGDCPTGYECAGSTHSCVPLRDL